MRCIAALAIALGLPLSVFADPTSERQALLGTYRGHLHMDSGMMTEVGMDLVVEAVEKGRVTATLTLYNMRVEAAGSCNGKYPMKGRLDGNKLTLFARTGGDSGNCRFRLELVKEGDKLTGTSGRGSPIELAK